ncbi:META domain-containing protein [Streptomyces sp. NPDC015661]|uniref:META domain-containing protein n=1 Tax=Streptomyces sp. NPDC015661 TaxID=3364961 RepID=UPI0036F7A3ED
MHVAVKRGFRARTIVGTLLTALLLISACTPTGTRRAAAPPTPKGPGGNGGLLVGARWYVQWVTVDGRTITAPPHAAAWVEAGYDNTTEGSYGCTPFKAATTVTETTLTVGETTDGTAPAGRCPASYLAFEEKLRKLLSGPLDISRRVDDLTMDLRNRSGDYVAVKLIRPEGLFGSRWRLDHLVAGDSVVPIIGGKEVYYVFHRDGTVTGRAGCNDFTGRATFDGDVLSMYRLTATTHRTCSRELMEQERGLLTDEKEPRRMECLNVLTHSFEATDQTQGLNYFGYNWVAMSDG